MRVFTLPATNAVCVLTGEVIGCGRESKLRTRRPL
jgi:hypothetical protein